MKKVLIFVASALMFINGTHAAVRDGGVASRAKNGTSGISQQRLTNSTTVSRSSVRKSTLTPRGTNAKSSVSRAATARADNATVRTTSARGVALNQSPVVRVVSRAATENIDLSQTRTGAEYERCKTAYFTCMDQFCGLKNDDYRRCSCSNRVYDLTDVRETLISAGEQLTVFTENLDVVGMTAAQAVAMKTPSDGENALTVDASASKALLQAILNSIRGQDSSVGGKMSDLNSINISFDTANAFGTMDAGQAIATYNGQNLYSAVYPQCRAAVRADCNDASLQRAITAYLMAIEQDCNTVETAIETKRKEMKAAVREGDAMLDLARIENRQKHNSSDIPTCIAAVESAILSEQVCGAGYHKCLDNGEFIDISTGAPIAGVANFDKLEKTLTFADGVEAANQKLSKNVANRTFVTNFEAKTKKFAADALDKCVADADTVWAEYLDRALLDIYYAQRAKVAQIRQGCFDFVSACYMDNDKSITDAMRDILGDAALTVMPDKVVLSSAMCNDYVQSCNSMFQAQGDIIAQYIENRTETDRLVACRAVVKQCFDSFGGTNYENFYYPYSGLFSTGKAPDWFTLYEYNETPDGAVKTIGNYSAHYKSTCAKQLAQIESCNDVDIIEQAFGGFDIVPIKQAEKEVCKNFGYEIADSSDSPDDVMYGVLNDNGCLRHRITRPTGVATEVYNQVLDILTTQCTNLNGRFLEIQSDKKANYTECEYSTQSANTDDDKSWWKLYGIGTNENMCPRDYGLAVDTESWGICSCWENGARRSKNGMSAKCVAVLPTDISANDTVCENGMEVSTAGTDDTKWCTRNVMSTNNQVCPISIAQETKEEDDKVTKEEGDKVTKEECDTFMNDNTNIPDGLNM